MGATTDVNDSGLVFGKYTVIRRLMVGGMGEIFLARQSGVAGFDRLVILKTLLPELAEQPGFIDQFLDEARVAATLNHPNIVNIFEVGDWRGMYVIAMEYIKGDNLARLMAAIERAGDRMPHRVAVKIAMDAASALDHAHFAVDADGKPLGIVHRDIGLQNLMVRADGVTKVVDFGIARAANRSARTRTGLIKGKLQYMPPEQLTGGELDGRSDQFSLGVVLWEMLAGARLFKGDNEFQTMHKVLNEAIPPLRTVDQSIDLRLEAITMRMLSREKADRYPRCAAVADDLRQYLHGTGHEVAEGDVAAVVQRYIGSELAEATRDLTPSTEVFAHGLSRTPGSGTQARTAVLGAARGKRTVVLASAVVSVGIVAAAAFLAWRQLSPSVSNRAGREVTPFVAAPPPAPNVGMALELKGPPGARVFVDGNEWPEKTPTVVRGLAVGPHELQLQLPNRKPLVKRVNLAVGKPVVVAEPPPASGMVLDIRDPVGARVLVDGRPWKEPVPTVVSGLTPGLHQVQLAESGKPPVVRKVELSADTPVIIQPAAAADMPTLTITTKPDGATVSIQDQVVGTTPLTLKTIEPGVVCAVELTKPGHEPATREVVLGAQENRALLVTLAKAKGKPSRDKKKDAPVAAAPASPSAPGFLTLNTTPWVKVSVDGRPFGSTPLYKIELAAGGHVLQLVNEEVGVNVTRKVTIESGRTAKLNLDLAK
ncbi:MAG: PEGA domain-containing protein [Deltaproteobacteria bacterium]|nr:PEGA domain-containing protein [Deltaproteobacteria bacterium]